MGWLHASSLSHPGSGVRWYWGLGPSQNAQSNFMFGRACCTHRARRRNANCVQLCCCGLRIVSWCQFFWKHATPSQADQGKKKSLQELWNASRRNVVCIYIASAWEKKQMMQSRSWLAMPGSRTQEASASAVALACSVQVLRCEDSPRLSAHHLCTWVTFWSYLLRYDAFSWGVNFCKDYNVITA